jgi:hypothetical protein
MSQMLHRSVREGEIREAVMSPVAWSTSCAGTPVTRACYGRPGPDAVIKHLHGCKAS